VSIESSATRDEIRARPRVTYLLVRYPVLTKTFIDREIMHLIERGVDLQIVSIRQPDSELSPHQAALRKRVRYLLPLSPLRLLMSHLIAATRRPADYFRTLIWLLSRPHPKGTRFLTAQQFAVGVYLARMLRDRRGVHIHAHFADGAATVALVASRFLDCAYSVSAHARELYVSPVLLRERIGHAAFTVTCTECNRRYLADLVGPQAAQRVVCLYHGLDASDFDARKREPHETERPRLLAVAQLQERKGLEDLVRACRVLVDRGLQFTCEIVGEGPLRPRLAMLVANLGLADVVSLTGALPFPAVMARLNRADIFVLPCVVASDGDRDGIPNVILEAMGVGLPVVTTPVSGIPEVVHDGETGLIVPARDPIALADAVARLMTDSELASRLGIAGRNHVREAFDVRHNVDLLIERFATVAS
jgi:glycosyltransferase involved in cell wall biosynthesis